METVVNKNTIKFVLRENIVTIIFVILSLIGMALSELNTPFILNELINRISRNSILVLSLIIPILAGIGLNFGLVVGAMAGQTAIIAVAYWDISGMKGFLLCIVLATPIAIFLGFLVGRLFNATKGQEMIAGMIVSFFANGIYQFIFLFLCGKIIPMKDTVMIKPDGIGLRNTISLKGVDGKSGIKYALDGIYRIKLFYVILIAAAVLIVFAVYKMIKGNKVKWQEKSKSKYLTCMVIGIILIILSILILNSGNSMYNKLSIPVFTWLVIAAVCAFTNFIMKTKIGQDFRTVGQSQHIAKVSGIHVNKTRIIATILSTVLAAWGQIIFLQNIGTMNTYGSHMQVGMFSIAAILIGGASVSNAKINQALLGVILFHMVFIVSPTAGKTLFGDAQIGEFFRAFVVYGVIGISLGLHAWKKRVSKSF